jgi:hypothetical protein
VSPFGNEILVGYLKKELQPSKYFEEFTSPTVAL